MKIIAFVFIFCGIIHSEISRSYSQVMHNLGDRFIVSKTTSVKNRKRYMGSSGNGLATIEMIGKKGNLYSASLMLGMPSDNSMVVAINCTYAAIFLYNVCGMKNALSWFRKAVVKGGGTYYADNCTIELSVIKNIGMVLIVVK